MFARSLVVILGLRTALLAQTAVGLPPVTVYSSQVANQSPTGTFAMPVSALRYEPLVDLQTRNLAEGQSDVTIRGGIFETTGFQLGALSLIDPQTGHYTAEIPIAPAMLGAPRVLTGADVAQQATNANVGAIAYAWRPVTTAGFASVGVGEFGLRRADFYQGAASLTTWFGARVSADMAVAHSESDGAVAFGDHRFDRVDGRLQLATAGGQTDLFAGYQAKFFGWPNLYTPFNSNESENLQTLLFAANHRTTLGAGDFVEAGAYYRRNKDDYAFNRFAALGPVHPFQHTTQVMGAAVGGRASSDMWRFNYRGELIADDLKSTSLTAGKYHSRTLGKLTFVPEKTWSLSGGQSTTLRFGATYDTSSHESGAGEFSPVVAWSHQFTADQHVYLSYARTTQLPSYTALNSSSTSGLFRGNSNLGREHTRNLEAGYDAAVAGWTTHVAAFWRRDDALVDWTFRRGVTARSANAVDVATVGLEVVARHAWGPADLVLGYTGLTKDPDYRGAAVDASFYALNYARHRATAALTWRVTPEFEVRLDNIARSQADNLLRTVGGNHALSTAVGFAYLPHAWRGAEISVQAENAWNEDFQEVPGVPAARRQISGGVRYTW